MQKWLLALVHIVFDTLEALGADFDTKLDSRFHNSYFMEIRLEDALGLLSSFFPATSRYSSMMSM